MAATTPTVSRLGLPADLAAILEEDSDLFPEEFTRLAEHEISSLVGASLPSSASAASFLKEFLVGLESVGRVPDNRTQPLNELTTKRLPIKQKALALLALEREFLEISARETTLGMKICRSLDLMIQCGIQAANNGYQWEFKYTFPKLIGTAEGFSFYLPLCMHMASHTTSSDLTDRRLAVSMNWDPQRLKPMERFLHEGTTHSHADVRSIAQGFLAMASFNRDTQTSHEIYLKELNPLILKLQSESPLLKDPDFLILLPICAPILYQLLLREVTDLHATFEESQTQTTATRNEFDTAKYLLKQRWHERAQAGYLEEQNQLYQKLFATLPKGMEARRNALFPSQFIVNEKTFLSKNPYPREAVQEVRVSSKTKGKKTHKAIAAAPAAPAPLPAPAWVSRELPFGYHGRVVRWLTMGKKEDASLETQRVKHGFSQLIDRLVRERDYVFERRETKSQSYYLLAQFDFPGGKSERGVISYGTFGKETKERCFHRYFSLKRDDELLQGSLQRVFDAIPVEEDDDTPLQTIETAEPALHIEYDPLLGLIKIDDTSNSVVISLFKMPT